MTTDSLEPIEPKEQSKADPPARASLPKDTDANAAQAELAGGAVSAPSRPKRYSTAPRLSPGISRSEPRDLHGAGLILAFVAGVIVVLALFLILAVSGSRREKAIKKIQDVYAYLRQGQDIVTTQVSTATIGYAEAGHAPDTEA